MKSLSFLWLIPLLSSDFVECQTKCAFGPYPTFLDLVEFQTKCAFGPYLSFLNLVEEQNSIVHWTVPFSLEFLFEKKISCSLDLTS